MPGGRGFLEKLKRNIEQRHKRIALLLREARKDRGLTQAQVAEVLGWRQSDVSKMEAGHLKPSVVELENFALMCSKPLDYFATWQAQLADDKGKKSLAIAEDKFQRRRKAVERRAATRRRFRTRKQKMPLPTEPGLQQEAFKWAMAQQEIKRHQRLARIRKFPSRNT